MTKTTTRPILHHECLIGLKLTSITVISQLVLQCIPLPPSQYSALSWILLAGVVVSIGLKSDNRFYKRGLTRHINLVRFTCNSALFLGSSVASFFLVKYLEISDATTLDDPEMLDSSPTVGPDLFHDKLVHDFSHVSGIILLLGTHYLALLGLISFSRIALLLFQSLLESFVHFQFKRQENMKKEN